MTNFWARVLELNDFDEMFTWFVSHDHWPVTNLGGKIWGFKKYPHFGPPYCTWQAGCGVCSHRGNVTLELASHNHSLLRTRNNFRPGLRSRSRPQSVVLTGIRVGVRVDKFSSTPTFHRLRATFIARRQNRLQRFFIISINFHRLRPFIVSGRLSSPGDRIGYSAFLLFPTCLSMFLV